uniref:Uncharacterized protein n=1 Tax=Chromera velia CCMP2878 TaxID=1169474 RepID=A0A0G4IC84_9ALVE|eukprot:Cvel_12967.t1-p1 / transcript=Cvel_12967.t1 / gene=Cvel_12967 / organism=Chromera_velia_CCMP2878 / gene_product=hypothetical protein / transcript_product=hypothetical protein / location=Cvel_scaffold868:24651-25088(-) / protein_length=146 / sequence_SO=supercontig / SO=protein_coding / is_pseudo=false
MAYESREDFDFPTLTSFLAESCLFTWEFHPGGGFTANFEAQDADTDYDGSWEVREVRPRWVNGKKDVQVTLDITIHSIDGCTYEGPKQANPQLVEEKPQQMQWRATLRRGLRKIFLVDDRDREYTGFAEKGGGKMSDTDEEIDRLG